MASGFRGRPELRLGHSGTALAAFFHLAAGAEVGQQRRHRAAKQGCLRPSLASALSLRWGNQGRGILAPTTGELGDGGGRWRGQVEGTRRVGEGLASRLSRPFPPILTILLGSHTWPLKVALIGSPVPMSQEGCGGVQGGLKVGGHALRAAADLDIGARSRPQLEREVGVRDSGLNTTARRAESNATPCTFNLAMSARASTLGRRIFRPSLLGQRIELHSKRGNLRKGSSFFGPMRKASMVGFISNLAPLLNYLRRRSPGPPFPPDHRQAGERGAINVT
jgi:hypothetical protein